MADGGNSHLISGERSLSTERRKAIASASANTRRAVDNTSPSGYPRLAKFLNNDNHFMVYRRFASLHVRALQLQDKLSGLERSLDNRDLMDEYREFDQQSAYKGSRDWLFETIKEKLSEYNSLLYRMKSLRSAPGPDAYRYQSVREYLYRGSPIYMDYSETSDSRWAKYERELESLLQDSDTASWLDGPLDPASGERLIPRKQQREIGSSRDGDISWIFRLKRRLHRLVMSGIILFWISHVTAALAFGLIKNTSGPEGQTLANILLASWYFSAVIIIVQGLLAKGLVYARKVILGGVLACLVGFYILKILMSVATASSVTAIPTLITAVLLLIQTM